MAERFESPQDALVAVMLSVSVADQDMTDNEMSSIGAIIDLLPAFRGYDKRRIDTVSTIVADLLGEEDGLDELIRRVRETLPAKALETAYALACDVAAADGTAEQTELRMLEMLRYDLGVDRLTAAAIERGARARHQRI